jgi:hypothetical protein
MISILLSNLIEHFVIHDMGIIFHINLSIVSTELSSSHFSTSTGTRDDVATDSGKGKE